MDFFGFDDEQLGFHFLWRNVHLQDLFRLHDFFTLPTLTHISFFIFQLTILIFTLNTNEISNEKRHTREKNSLQKVRHIQFAKRMNFFADTRMFTGSTAFGVGSDGNGNDNGDGWMS